MAHALAAGAVNVTQARVIVEALDALPADLADGKLLCAFHHHRAHEPGWEVHHHANGSTTFRRRT